MNFHKKGFEQELELKKFGTTKALEPAVEQSGAGFQTKEDFLRPREQVKKVRASRKAPDNFTCSEPNCQKTYWYSLFSSVFDLTWIFFRSKSSLNRHIAMKHPSHC